MIRPAEAIVVDASVAAKWLLTDEEHAAKAGLLRDHLYQGQVALAAPNFILLEVASAISVASRGQQPRLRQDEGREAIERFFALGLELFADGPLILPALALSERYGCSVYDALYLALAQQLSLQLVTADRRFYRRVRQLPDVLWIGNYSPAA